MPERGERGKKRKNGRVERWRENFFAKGPFFTPPPSILRGGHEERGAFLF